MLSLETATGQNGYENLGILVYNIIHVYFDCVRVQTRILQKDLYLTNIITYIYN